MKERFNKLFDISRYYPQLFTIVFVLILFQYSFGFLEAIFYDLRVKYDLGTTYNDNIILVIMDEESDEFLGERYPYSFATHYHLLENIVVDRPSVINFFVALKGPSNPLEDESLSRFKGSISSFISNGGIFRFGITMNSWGPRLPPGNLRNFGYSLGLIDQDKNVFSKDGVTRRVVLNYSGEDTLHLWTANEYRKHLGLKPISAQSHKGSYYLREADATFALTRFYTSPSEIDGKIRSIPFHSVRVGNFPKGYFTNKIVLIGPSYISNVEDYVATPFDKEDSRSSKMALHAIFINALINGDTVHQIPKNSDLHIMCNNCNFLSRL